MSAHQFKLGANKHILLAVDGAGWHTSSELKLPLGLHLTFLPPYSPELQPAERLWTLVDEPIANQYFETLDDERGGFISPMPIFASTAGVDSRVNWFSLVD